MSKESKKLLNLLIVNLINILFIFILAKLMGY